MVSKGKCPRPLRTAAKYRIPMTYKKTNKKDIEDLTHTTFNNKRRKGLSLGLILRQNAYIFLMMVGVGAGLGLGIGLRFTPEFSDPRRATRLISYINFPGELMLRVMSMLMVPVIVSSLVSAVASMDIGKTKKIGLGTMMYYLLTTTVAIIEGFIMIFSVRPGQDLVGVHRPLTDIEGSNVSVIDAFMDMTRNVFPDNLIAASMQSVKTKVKHEIIALNGTNVTYIKESFQTRNIPSVNILGLTLWSILFGLVFASMGPRAKVMVDIFQVTYDATMKVFKYLLWIYPVGICFMIAASILRMVEPVKTLSMLGKMAASGTGGVLIHIFITLPALFFVFTRRNPYTFMKKMFPAWMTVFATYSSSATLPVTIDCLDKVKHVDKRITRFMCPIGAIVNMDGTAIYEAMVIVFIATINGRVTGPGDIIVAGLTTLAVSIGTPTVGTMVAVYAILFSSMGLPLEDIALLVPFDWCLGRIRVIANVWGDCVGVAIVSHFSLRHLKKEDIIGKRKNPKRDDKSTGSEEEDEDKDDDNEDEKASDWDDDEENDGIDSIDDNVEDEDEDEDIDDII